MNIMLGFTLVACIGIVALACCYRINRNDPDFFRSLGSIFKRQKIEYVRPFSVAVRDYERRRFTPSFSLTVGGRSPHDLARAVWPVAHDYARVCMVCGFKTSPEVQRIDFVQIATSDLGLSVGNSSWSTLNDEFCLRWSKENLSGQEIGLCESEDALQLRLQYRDQPVEQCIGFAMKPIITGGNYPMAFWIGRGLSGRRFLTARTLVPYMIHSHSLIFRLREVSTMSVQ
ncbi:MAG: hypothetical protein Q7S37_02945 [bacterium]|nr:hypothetical protein [bacterium]